MSEYVEQLEKALKAYEAAHEDLFVQCCSNPVYNAWGKQVDMTKLNEAHQLAYKLIEVE